MIRKYSTINVHQKQQESGKFRTMNGCASVTTMLIWNSKRKVKIFGLNSQGKKGEKRYIKKSEQCGSFCLILPEEMGIFYHM